MGVMRAALRLSESGGRVCCLLLCLHVYVLRKQSVLLLSPLRWQARGVPGTGRRQASVVVTVVLAVCAWRTCRADAVHHLCVVLLSRFTNQALCSAGTMTTTRTMRAVATAQESCPAVSAFARGPCEPSALCSQLFVCACASLSDAALACWVLVVWASCPGGPGQLCMGANLSAAAVPWWTSSPHQALGCTV